MQVDDKLGLYAAFKSKDTRFDGRFFVGVSSTGIYCRPVCHARMPKIENCTFYPTAAEAEQAGYRPCLLCRPELAPGRSVADAKSTLANRAARLLEEHSGSGLSVEELAVKLGCTDRHLRRVFSEEFRVSPVRYLQTCRLLLAKSLLTDSDLSVVDVTMVSGFGSLRRFNDAFKSHYRLSPTEFRKQAALGGAVSGDVTLSLGYRSPYQWEKLLAFLAFRAIPGVEVVRDGEYLRTVRLMGGNGAELTGWIRVCNKPAKNMLAVTVSSSLLPALPQVLARIRHLFDLRCDPDAISDVLTAMNEVKPGLFTPGLRLPGCFDSFEMCVRAVLGQQVTVKAASTLAARMAATFGTTIETGIEGLGLIFPSPETIIALPGDISDQLGPIGVTSARSKTILSLAHAFVDRTIDFGQSAVPEVEIARLCELPGIGSWTAHYIAMRSMGWPDAFLETDYGVKKVFEGLKPKEILERSQAWRPWRSYATINIWNSL
ncbi:MAG TPA: adenosine deaminase [Coriobacteriia bacterium]|nr:adenosine deaminase [Coriobacteriia bacterium]